jgi:hypothetical protein
MGAHVLERAPVARPIAVDGAERHQPLQV